MFHVSGILHCTFPMSFITTDFIAYDKNIAYEEATISNWMWGMEGIYLGKKKKRLLFCKIFPLYSCWNCFPKTVSLQVSYKLAQSLKLIQ